jgi:hypothetical protein
VAIGHSTERHPWNPSMSNNEHSDQQPLGTNGGESPFPHPRDEISDSQEEIEARRKMTYDPSRMSFEEHLGFVIDDARARRDVETIKRVLQEHPWYAKTPSATMNLNIMAEADWMAGLEVMVQHGADVNTWETNGTYPLKSAVNVYSHEAVRWLLDHDADPNLDPGGGWTAVFVAANDPDPELKILKLLLERGGKLELCSVIALGWIDEARAMLAKDPRAITKGPDCPSGIGVEAVNGVLAHADRQRQVGIVASPEEVAARFREMLDLLVAHGAIIDGKAVYSHVRGYASDYPQILDKLLEHTTTE